jgi:transcriptional regulator with XRE-family HTH domain
MAQGKTTEKPLPAGGRLKAWLKGHRQSFPRDGLFADEVGMSAGRLSQLMSDKSGRELPSPTLAERIERATRGAILAPSWFENLGSGAAARAGGAR